MATNDLFTSDNGVGDLKKSEAVIPGLYNDQVGYGTFGVGHLVHPKDKWGSFLYEAAAADDTWKKSLQKMWPGKSFRYLPGQVAFDANFADLKSKALTAARAKIGKSKYGKEYDKLSPSEKEAVDSASSGAVDEEARLLAKTAEDVLKQDLVPYESAVRSKITVALTQAEFDALVSLCFNIGVGNFGKSSVVKTINQGKHKSGDAKTRQEAITAIEGAFNKWVKADGKVLDALVKRRAAEASAFLAGSRAELAELNKGPVPAAPPASKPAPTRASYLPFIMALFERGGRITPP